MEAIATRDKVFEAANNMVSNNITPTQRKIREYLGGGSNGTLNKYLKEWKEDCFKRKISENFANEKFELQALLAKQQEINSEISSQLQESELKNQRYEQKINQMEKDFKDLLSKFISMIKLTG